MTTNNKAELIANHSGQFLSAKINGYKSYADLDGTHAAEYLAAAGFDVIHHYDTGNNGLAITSEGYALSTNGYFYQIN